MKTTIIERRISCNMCEGNKAQYDGKTKLGTWAYMCAECFHRYGVGLGLGKGQELVTLGEEK